MNRVEVHKAHSVFDAEKVESVCLIVGDTLPSFDKLVEQDIFTDREAKHIEEVLYNSLPGATYDRLIGHMLERKASHFRVSHAR